MEASRPQGSFGIPEHIRKQMEDSQRAKAAPKEAPAPPAPEPEKTAEPGVEAKSVDAAPVVDDNSDREKLQKTVQFWEEQLEVKITPRDVQDYIFKGRLVKDGIFIAAFHDDKDPEKFKDFKVTFQSHTPADLDEIDEKMAAYREKGKFTADGLENEKSLRMLSHVLLSADGRSLGKTADERYKNIKNLGGGLVALIADAWDGFNLLLRHALREKKLYKK